ncbi:hypothetical protein IFT47_08965 [Pseudomonas sp. CFBP 13711]|uniref:hypothetical protein n=1 Tax=unclassified Pseudomonas TaxID=196821 RepID=UPI00177B9DBC|nr:MULTISPECIES: hypothetical protein [unclassified Pseudomonas]MBD8706764.1 hypothetical protein [Pseudomonas sp. CFBP 13711]MBD8712322.1 hypothetical protein [Pseudomonas sp. CFBP 13715]
MKIEIEIEIEIKIKIKIKIKSKSKSKSRSKASRLKPVPLGDRGVRRAPKPCTPFFFVAHDCSSNHLKTTRTPCAPGLPSPWPGFCFC